MRFYEKVLGIGALVAALAGCSNPVQTQEVAYKAKEAKRVSGVPISVACRDYGTTFSTLSTVIKTDGDLLLAYNNMGSCKCAQIEALIKSEISDGDEEEIILKGSYIKDNFGQEMLNFNYIKVNGYEFDVP